MSYELSYEQRIFFTIQSSKMPLSRIWLRTSDVCLLFQNWTWKYNVHVTVFLDPVISARAVTLEKWEVFSQDLLTFLNYSAMSYMVLRVGYEWNMGNPQARVLVTALLLCGSSWFYHLTLIIHIQPRQPIMTSWWHGLLTGYKNNHDPPHPL